jgi:DNA-binding transcriptional ArsR family regulator
MSPGGANERESMSFNKLLYLKELHGAKISAGAFRVLVTMLDYADQYGKNAYPGVARLANDCDMTERTVQRHLSNLRDGGYLVEESRGGRGRDGRGRASVYRIFMRHERRDKTVDQGDKMRDSTRQNERFNMTNRARYYDATVTPSNPRSNPASKHASKPCPACGRRDCGGEPKFIHEGPMARFAYGEEEPPF